MKRFPRARKTANLSKSLHQQLNMYALAASAAGVSLMSFVPQAEARIVYTPAHKVIGANGYYGIDFNRDGIVDVSIINSAQHFNSASVNIIRAFPAQGESGGVEGGLYKGTWPGTFFEAALKPGARIGHRQEGPPFFYQRGVMVGQCAHGSHNSAPPCSSHAYGTLGSWANVKNRYLGVTFTVSGKTHYGWVRLTVKLSRKPFKATAILTGYAYETIPNKAIIAGKTKGPDVTTVSPASLGHLAAGASALPAWRVKQTAAATR